MTATVTTSSAALPVGSPPSQDISVAVQDLHVSLGQRAVLCGVSFSLAPHDFVGLLGPNGAGKTTLLRTMLGLLSAERGTVAVGGPTTARGDSARARRRALGYVPQRHNFAWDYPISVVDAVVNARVGQLGWLRWPGRADFAAALEALDQVNLLAVRNRPIGELSGGQRQRVLLARALVNQPTVLLLDEPFTGLDMPSQESLTDLFAQLAAQGRTVLMSTHDIVAARHCCGRLLLLNRRVIADGPADVVAAQDVWASTYGVRPDSPLLRGVQGGAQ